MKNKIVPILNLCIALFVFLYAGYMYRMTENLSLVTIVLLLAGFAPALHMAWLYLKVKIEQYQDQRYIHYLKK